MLKKLLIIMVSRVLGAAVAGGAAWLASKYAVTIPDETQRELVNQAIGVLTVGLATYGVGHKLIDNKVNPGDSANHALATEAKRASVQMKAIEEINGL